MKKIAIAVAVLLIIVVAAAFMIPSVRISIMGVQPAYQFKPGETTVYKVSQKMVTKMEMENVPEALAKNFPVKMLTTDVDQTVTVEVEKMEGNVAILKISRKKDDVTIKRNEVMMEIDEAQKGRTETITLKVLPTGEIMTDGKENTSKSQMQSRESARLTHLIKFPNKVMKPGFKWDDEIKMVLHPSLQKVIFKGNVTYKLEKFTKHRNVDCLYFTYQGKLSPSTASGAPTTLKGEADLKGNLYFDIGQGEVVDSKTDINLSAELRLKGAVGKAMNTANFKIKPQAVFSVETKRAEK